MKLYFFTKYDGWNGEIIVVSATSRKEAATLVTAYAGLGHEYKIDFSIGKIPKKARILATELGKSRPK